jgi:tRNA/tmRNA/rRNA uracil-C5-methylase (TrmA/RlmC/RlmD family)
VTSSRPRPAAKAATDPLAPGPDDGIEGALVELTIGPIAHGGHCVSRDGAGRVFFVRHALPGERVRAVVTEEHGSYLRADAVQILAASPHRVEPPCPYAGGAGRDVRRGRPCGGCDLQHAGLEYQRELKTAVVREQLLRLGGLDESTVDRLNPTVRPVPPVPGQPDGQGWRTRVQYTVDSTGRAGLLAHRSHEVVAVDRCLIAHAAVRGADVLARSWPEHDASSEPEQRAPASPATTRRHVVEVVAGCAGEATVLARRDGATPIVVAGPDTVTERAGGRVWRLPPTAFWQVHPSAADTLTADVAELLAPRPGDRIWDLYGGAGLFAAVLAPRATSTGRVSVVESDAVAVAAARENLRDLTTVTIVHSDVARALANPRWRAVDIVGGRSVGGVDIVVLDPPRTGAGAAVVAAVAARSPRAVAYVACDPAALARDVRTFGSHGYELAALRAYDLFPHTHHVECVALLARRDNN